MRDQVDRHLFPERRACRTASTKGACPLFTERPLHLEPEGPSCPSRCRVGAGLLHGLQASIADRGRDLLPGGPVLRPRAATSSGAMEVVAPFRANELRPEPEGTWPSRFTFNFGGKPCLVVRTPDGRDQGLQCRLHAPGLHGRVPPVQGRHLLQLPQRRLRPERAQRFRPAASAAGSLQSGPAGQARPGGDRCLPQRLTSRRATARGIGPPQGVLLRAAGAGRAVALAAKKHVPVHRTTPLLFPGRDGAVPVCRPGGHGHPALAVLQAFARPGLRERARDHDRSRFGWLFRSIHSWSANLLIGVLFLHVLTTYIMRAYRRPGSSPG